MRTTALSFLFCITALAAEPLKLTDAVRADIQLMRERDSIPGGSGAVYATPRATAAARRVFAALPLAGMTRQQVTSILGEPSEVFAASPSAPGGSLVFRLDHGYDGIEFILKIGADSRITKVSSQLYE